WPDRLLDHIRARGDARHRLFPRLYRGKLCRAHGGAEWGGGESRYGKAERKGQGRRPGEACSQSQGESSCQRQRKAQNSEKITLFEDDRMIFSPTLSADAELANAPDYAAWSKAARAHDAKSGMQAWREADASEHFDFKAIRARLERLRALSAAGDVKGLLFVLNEGIHGNIDGMGHERLYQKARFGTKILIEAYVAEVVAALGKIASSPAVPREEKRDFFRRAQHCYGRSALLLSGSGSFLFFHVGVVRALWDEGVLPNILAGSSGGSVVAAIVSTRQDPEVGAFLASERLASPARGAETRRLASDEVRARLAELIPDLTFREAWERSGRHLNVSVAPAEKHQNGRLLNAITAPN